MGISIRTNFYCLNPIAVKRLTADFTLDIPDYMKKDGELPLDRIVDDGGFTAIFVCIILVPVLEKFCKTKEERKLAKAK